MKIVVLTDSAGKVVGASIANGDERTISNIENLLGTASADLRCQIIKADTLVDLEKFVAIELKEAAAEEAEDT